MMSELRTHEVFRMPRNAQERLGDAYTKILVNMGHLAEFIEIEIWEHVYRYVYKDTKTLYVILRLSLKINMNTIICGIDFKKYLGTFGRICWEPAMKVREQKYLQKHIQGMEEGLRQEIFE